LKAEEERAAEKEKRQSQE